MSTHFVNVKKSSVKILAVTDEISKALYDYFEPERWRDIDLVLSAGDLPPEYLDFLATTLGAPVVYVRGNHDGDFERQRYAGLENVHGRIVRVKGLTIAGFEGSRRYNDGPVQYSERQMRAIFAQVLLKTVRRGTPDLVLTHAPPAGVHDGGDLCHHGFETFNAAIRAWSPAYFVHGHVHAYDPLAELVTRVGATTVLNAYPYRVFTVRLDSIATDPRPPDRRINRYRGSTGGNVERTAE